MGNFSFTKQLTTNATNIDPIFIKIGVIPSSSATTGAKIVAVRAITLQKPNMVAAKIVGMSLTLAM